MSEKKQQEKIMIHPKLGEMKYDHYHNAWCPISSNVTKVPLWGKVFEVAPEFMAKDAEQQINSLQEESYESFSSLIVEQNALIEQMVREYHARGSEEEAAVSVTPINIYFGRRGECLLAFQDTGAEYNDDDFPGFTMFLSSKKLLFDPTDQPVFNLKKCMEEEEAFRYIREHGMDPVFGYGSWDLSILEVNIDEPDETEREERKKQFQLKYGQELLKYEQEKAEKEKQWQERYDSIEMPELLDIGLIRFAVVVIIMWVLFFVLKYFVKWLAAILIIPAAFATILFLMLCCSYYAGYFAARKDFDAYRRKVMEEKSE